MTLTVKITTGDAALADDPASETARILADLAGRIKRHGLPDRGDPYTLRDYNGNTVGKAATGTR